MSGSRQGDQPAEEPAPLTDRSLLRRVRDGQSEAATELFTRYATRLRALAERQLGEDLSARLDGDDIVQSVFRTFFRRLDTDSYTVPEGDDLWRLLLVIALHKIRNNSAHHRAAKRDVRATAHGALLDGQASSGEDSCEAMALRLTVEELLSELSPGHRSIIVLRIEGHEIAEIARRTQRSKRSVERVLQEFRRQAEAALL